MLRPLVRVVRRAPMSHPCPTCGRPGRRKRSLFRRIRSLAYRQVAYCEVHYAEYQARCPCCKSFRSWPLTVPPKADYDERVRQAVLDRILDDGLNVQRTRAALRRDFLLEVSEGFVYDCLRWQVAQLELAPYRQFVWEQFSGTLCVDELHLGRYTLLLATDPLADLPVAFALVGANDQDHLRRFLQNLKYQGLLPRVVVTDGSKLYPRVLAELWPRAQHQLCVFHLLADLNELILKAARRLARRLERRGRAGRKRRRGRPTKAQQQARAAQGPGKRQQAKQILKHRFLLVKKAADLSVEQQATLEELFGYEPELETLWEFALRVQELFEPGIRVQAAWRRRAALLRAESFQAIPELVQALGLLAEEQFRKASAFLRQPLGAQVRTNNHVERTNRRLRYQEEVRYKWRRRRWVVRFVVLALERWWRQAQAEAKRRVAAGVTPKERQE